MNCFIIVCKIELYLSVFRLIKYLLPLPQEFCAFTYVLLPSLLRSYRSSLSYRTPYVHTSSSFLFFLFFRSPPPQPKKVDRNRWRMQELLWMRQGISHTKESITGWYNENDVFYDSNWNIINLHNSRDICQNIIEWKLLRVTHPIPFS